MKIDRFNDKIIYWIDFLNEIWTSKFDWKFKIDADFYVQKLKNSVKTSLISIEINLKLFSEQGHYYKPFAFNWFLITIDFLLLLKEIICVLFEFVFCVLFFYFYTKSYVFYQFYDKKEYFPK